MITGDRIVKIGFGLALAGGIIMLAPSPGSSQGFRQQGNALRRNLPLIRTNTTGQNFPNVLSNVMLGGSPAGTPTGWTAWGITQQAQGGMGGMQGGGMQGGIQGMQGGVQGMQGGMQGMGGMMGGGMMGGGMMGGGMMGGGMQGGGSSGNMPFPGGLSLSDTQFSKQFFPSPQMDMGNTMAISGSLFSGGGGMGGGMMGGGMMGGGMMGGGMMGMQGGMGMGGMGMGGMGMGGMGMGGGMMRGGMGMGGGMMGMQGGMGMGGMGMKGMGMNGGHGL